MKIKKETKMEKNLYPCLFFDIIDLLFMSCRKKDNES